MWLCVLILPLLLALGGVMLVAQASRAGRRLSPLVCWKCRYPRAGLEYHAPCPECGMLPPEWVTRPNTATPREANRILLLALVLLLVMFAVWVWKFGMLASFLVVPSLILKLLMRGARGAVLRRSYLWLVGVTLGALTLVNFSITFGLLHEMARHPIPDMGVWIVPMFLNPLIVSVLCLAFGAATRLVVALTPESAISRVDA